MKVLSVLIILAMALSIETDMGTYTHEYQCESRTGYVSNETGPIVIILILEPYSVNVFEFNCSEGDEIKVQMWDCDKDPMFFDWFTDEASYLIVNDSEKTHVLSASPDDLYYPSLPGITVEYDSPLHENVTIEIRGEGNYTLMVHWRELEEWEKGKSSYSMRIAFEPTPLFYVIIGITLMFIGSIAAVVIIIWRLRERSLKDRT